MPRGPLVLAGVRTPVGRHGGGLSGVRPDDLLAGVLREAVQRSPLPRTFLEAFDRFGRSELAPEVEVLLISSADWERERYAEVPLR